MVNLLKLAVIGNVVRSLPTIERASKLAKLPKTSEGKDENRLLPRERTLKHARCH